MKMIAKPEWFVSKQGFTGKMHLIPTMAAGWIYYLGVFVAFIIADAILKPLVIVVMAAFIIDLIQVGIKLNKK